MAGSGKSVPVCTMVMAVFQTVSGKNTSGYGVRTVGDNCITADGSDLQRNHRPCHLWQCICTPDGGLCIVNAGNAGGDGNFVAGIHHADGEIFFWHTETDL